MNAFHTLMLGLKMLPSYMGESYEEFFAACDMLEADQEKLVREAALFVELQKEEVAAIVCFCADKPTACPTRPRTWEPGPEGAPRDASWRSA
jgi:hypothetical protein